MVEVFKTNVRARNIANRIIERVHKEFPHCRANFDLTDVDRILRVKCDNSMPDSNAILQLVAKEGFKAEVLPDEPAPGQNTRLCHQLERPSNNLITEKVIITRQIRLYGNKHHAAHR